MGNFYAPYEPITISTPYSKINHPSKKSRRKQNQVQPSWATDNELFSYAPPQLIIAMQNAQARARMEAEQKERERRIAKEKEREKERERLRLEREHEQKRIQEEMRRDEEDRRMREAIRRLELARYVDEANVLKIDRALAARKTHVRVLDLD